VRTRERSDAETAYVVVRLSSKGNDKDELARPWRGERLIARLIRSLCGANASYSGTNRKKGKRFHCSAGVNKRGGGRP